MFGKLLSKLKLGERRATDEGPGQSVEVQRAGGGLSVPRFGLVMFLVGITVLGGAGVAAYLQFEAAMTARAAAFHRSETSAVAARIAGHAAALGEVVARLAADPRLGPAVVHGEAAVLAEVEAAVTRALPGVLRARVITPAIREPERSASPALGYACLDLVRSVEAGRLPPVELHFAGTEDQHVDIVRAVRLDGRVVGGLLVSLDPETVAPWLREGLSSKAYAELVQTAGGATVMVAKAGSASLRTGGGSRTGVPGTSWSLAHWAPPGSVVSDGQKAAFFSVFVAGAAVLMVISLGAVVLFSRLLRRDLLQLINHFVEVFNGQRMHSVSMKLIEIQKAVRMMDEILPAGGTLHRRMSPQPELRERDDGGYSVTESEDVPPSDLMFLRSDGVSVEEMVPPKAKEDGG